MRNVLFCFYTWQFQLATVDTATYCVHWERLLEAFLSPHSEFHYWIVSALNELLLAQPNFIYFFYLSLAYTDFSKLFEWINDNMYNRWWKSQSIWDWDVLLWNCSKTNLFNLHNFSKFYPPVLLLNILHDTKSVPVQTGWLDVAFLCEACMFSLCLIRVSPNVKRNICYDCKRLESCPVCVSPSISPPWPLGGQAFKIEASVYIDILHSVPTFLETYLYNCKIVPLTVTLKQA